MTPFSQREAAQLVDALCDAAVRANIYAGRTFSEPGHSAEQRMRDVVQLRDNLKEEVISGLLGGQVMTAPLDGRTDGSRTECLLGLAIGYVEAYVGRFPKNVRPEHLHEFRRWRDSHPAHVVIVIHESRNQ